ncbi:MAG: DUF4159 domain-containing protein [Verrucomicrobiae bacterium]
MASQQNPFVQKLIDKFSNARDFTISFVLHVILVAVFGTTVLFQAVQEPPDFEGEGGGFVGGEANAPAPPPDVPKQVPPTPNITVTPTASTISTITTVAAPSALNFTMAPMVVAPVTPTAVPAAQMAAPKPAGFGGDGLTKGQASAIKAFTGGWGKGVGSGTGTRNREFEFTAYLGQYAGGNWNSTIQVDANGLIWNGSLPNLLYFMSSQSKNKVKTNYKNVKAIKLDTDEIFSVKPPFIFLTGTRDFKLSEKEVENLQKYVRLGGAIWGDSSVPGRNSRFDIAFRREMKRVIPDVDKDWDPLPASHPIYTQAYFPEVKEIPAGLNFYKEPIYALKIFGEIAIIYTANDYGDMWQIGLTEQGQVDLRGNEKNVYVAINPTVWDNREIYLRNLTQPSLAQTYKFGTNLVIHLLTRWEKKTSTAPSL